jgi:hypothetical protein
MTKQEKFRKHLEWASKIVASWPHWKQSLLEDSLKPTNNYSRIPLNHPAMQRKPDVRTTT